MCWLPCSMSGKVESHKSATRAANNAICMSYLLMAAWISLSATVILFNKYVLSYAGFPFPITLTMIHMLFCSILTALLMHCGHWVGLEVQKVEMPAGTCVHPPQLVPLCTLCAVMPISMLQRPYVALGVLSREDERQI
jgi:hypothetical protein